MRDNIKIEIPYLLTQKGKEEFEKEEHLFKFRVMIVFIVNVIAVIILIIS